MDKLVAQSLDSVFRSTITPQRPDQLVRQSQVQFMPRASFIDESYMPVKIKRT